MKKRTFKEWLKQWDQGEFDLDRGEAEALHYRPETQEKDDDSWAHRPVRGLREGEYTLFVKVYPFAALLLASVMIFFFMRTVAELPPFASACTPANQSEVIRRYIENGLTETGAVNIVAGVILDYRAFDTLGESHVLFTAATAVFILMLAGEAELEDKRTRRILEADTVLSVTARVLFPLIVMFGFYVILCGHLGPGGGFSGGAVIGGGLILCSMAFGPERISRLINMKTYRGVVLCALLFYSIAKCYSFYCGAHHLETVFSPGTPGMIFSAGLILPLNIAVGLVVACTMYGFYSLFTRGTV